MIYLGCQRVEQVGQSTFPATATMEAIGSYSQTGAEAAAQPKTLSSEMDGSNRGLLTVPRSQVHQLAASDRPQNRTDRRQLQRKGTSNLSCTRLTFCFLRLHSLQADGYLVLKTMPPA